MMRVMMTSRSALLLAFADMFPAFALELLHIVVQPVEALFPELAVAVRKPGDFLQRRGDQPAWPALRIAPPLDEAGALEHLQVLRDCRQAHVERPRGPPPGGPPPRGGAGE